MENKKRERITKKDLGKKVILQEEAVVENVNEEVKNHDDAMENDSALVRAEFALPNGEFDFDRYELQDTRKLVVNRNVNTVSHKHIVYGSDESAQLMYNLINEVSLSSATTMITELEVGSVQEGKLHSITEKWAMVDINYREMLYIDMAKEDHDLIAGVRPGDTINVKILSNKTASREYALASISEGTKQATFTELRSAIDEGGVAYVGTVKSMIPGGGYIVTVQGIDCFMPGSLAGINKLADFESIIGDQMYVVPDSFSVKRGTIVVSHRAYLQAMIPTRLAELEANIDQVQKGTVTGTAKYGVFCEFSDCLTGMIHVNDLTPELLAAHKSGEINPGDPIEFKIKEIVSEKKIILTQVEGHVIEVDNSWEEFTTDLELPMVVENAVIRSIKDYGLFISVHGTIIGLAHISGFPKGTDLVEQFSKNQEIAVEVTKIDVDTKKVFLKVIGA